MAVRATSTAAPGTRHAMMTRSWMPPLGSGCYPTPAPPRSGPRSPARCAPSIPISPASGQADAGAEVAALIAARDHLLARAQSVPHPQTGPVVFVQHRNVVSSLRALVYRRKQPRRHLC